jgi:hypothetical protein
VPGYCPEVDLAQQVGVAVEQDEELHQRERGLGLAVLVTRKGVGAAAEDRGRLALVEREFLTDARDEAGIDDGVIGAVRSGGFPHAQFDA